MCRFALTREIRGPARPRSALGNPAATVLAVGLLTVSTAYPDGVYKWVDGNGNVHYGDRPPATAAPTEVEIEKSPVPTATDERRREKTRRLLDAMESERERKKEARARELAQSAKRKRNCAIAKRRVEILQRGNSIAVTGKNGERTYLDDEARANALARARELVRQWC